MPPCLYTLMLHSAVLTRYARRGRDALLQSVREPPQTLGEDRVPGPKRERTKRIDALLMAE